MNMGRDFASGKRKNPAGRKLAGKGLAERKTAERRPTERKLAERKREFSDRGYEVEYSAGRGRSTEKVNNRKTAKWDERKTKGLDGGKIAKRDNRKTVKWDDQKSAKRDGQKTVRWDERKTEKGKTRGTEDRKVSGSRSDFGADKRKWDSGREEKSGIRSLREGGDLEKGKTRCRAFGECGGCQMLHLPYEKQLALKLQETARLLKPYVRLEGIIGMEEPEHYRNKVNAAFTHDRQGKPLSGVYKEGTHYIIPVKECMLEDRKADEIIGSIRELLPSFKIKTFDEDTGYGLLRHVMVRVGHTTGQIMVVLVLSSPILPSKNNFVKALLKLHPDITTIVINVNERKTSMVLGDNGQVIYGKGYIEDTLCGITFKISPKSFYQVNAVQTEKLYQKAMEYAGLTGRETVLDAYCGIGTIGMVAAERAKRVIGVELNADAVKDAIANARRNKIKNVEFYQKDAGEFMVQLAEQGERVDTVFMDPPRSGSDEVFLSSLVRLAPKKVVYVSCNPETLARDLKYLTKKGYRVKKGVCLDMFPFCGHVECVVLMSRVEK